MTGKTKLRTILGISAAIIFFPAKSVLGAEDASITREQFLLLEKQNAALQEQLQKQQAVIDSLVHQVQDIRNGGEHGGDSNAMPVIHASEDELPAASSDSFHLGKVDITGEGGVAFFSSQPQGMFPHSTFRIDEARLFLEAPVWDDVYFYSEIDLASRESTSLGLNVGELYVDFEDVSKLWGQERMLNIRAGQFYIPFGEEYLSRFAMDNPLISHSVSDIWGTDAGVELYGKIGPVQYVAAVQNGGSVTTQSLQSDKSIAGHISYEPNKWLHLSASGMRTGNLSVSNGLSAVWFGNGFFRALNSPPASTFHANLAEVDAQVNLSCVQLKAAAGYINYDDDSPAGDDHRDIYYYYAEGVHDFTKQFYGAARFSEIFAHNGFPIVGNGDSNNYLFGPLTREYWRLSIGLGYRFGRNLLVKGEYSFNQGSLADGTARTAENQFSVEAAFKF
ncbi:MAG TPA: hypothetical protein VH413_11705 [Verrucomicrobiae bacterium]|jgi:hypothetical protein|nr:hypothetical protein [Verrucomicrobiae bacterium]